MNLEIKQRRPQHPHVSTEFNGKLISKDRPMMSGFQMTSMFILLLTLLHISYKNVNKSQVVVLKRNI